ncbi:hypothetical protein ACFWUP_26820 [Nocardia sp. NPDC058658]|uniref:hypothetical protein n=1 Tax=Nocardia sp. NPDC058658 TaxID=3346580 RepID=UPI00365BC153
MEQPSLPQNQPTGQPPRPGEWQPPRGRRKRPGYREQQARNARMFGGRRKWVLLALAAAVPISAVGSVAWGLISPRSDTARTGDCGYFTRPGRGGWDFHRRACTDPDAVLLITNGWSTQECATGDMNFAQSRRKNTSSPMKYLCTHLNATVGECVNDPGNVNAHLYRIRKVPCGPGVFEVDARVEARDPNVCDASRTRFRETKAITHAAPPVSFCLHKI